MAKNFKFVGYIDNDVWLVLEKFKQVTFVAIAEQLESAAIMFLLDEGYYKGKIFVNTILERRTPIRKLTRTRREDIKYNVHKVGGRFHWKLGKAIMAYNSDTGVAVNRIFEMAAIELHRKTGYFKAINDNDNEYYTLRIRKRKKRRNKV